MKASSPRPRTRQGRSCGRLATAWCLALAAISTFLPGAHAVTIDWVTVGDPGNQNDNQGYWGQNAGAVAESFQIMKYEFTNSQYAAFLNAVDPQGTNPNGIWNSSMGAAARGGITNTGATDGSRYAVKSDMGNKPVNYVSWFDAARVANWLQNGGLTYGTSDASAGAPQNIGAYSVGTATGGGAVSRNPGVSFYLPTYEQWYKTAFYKGGGTNSGYWVWATQSSGDAPPSSVTADAHGNGSAGNTGNTDNFNSTADWNGQDGNVTTVGTNGGPSAYGTFDQGGNVGEWNDTAQAAWERGVAGGSFGAPFANILSSQTGGFYSTNVEGDFLGFRLAAPVAVPVGVPEIDPAGFGSVAAILTGAIGLIERRRLKATAA